MGNSFDDDINKECRSHPEKELTGNFTCLILRISKVFHVINCMTPDSNFLISHKYPGKLVNHCLIKKQNPMN